MASRQGWIWKRDDWPAFRWDASRLAPALAAARLAQGKALGAARLLDPDLTLEAVAAILTEDGLTTSAIEGERFAPDAVRSSVARHLGLPAAGLPVAPRAVDGLVEVLLDATRRHERPSRASGCAPGSPPSFRPAARGFARYGSAGCAARSPCRWSPAAWDASAFTSKPDRGPGSRRSSTASWPGSRRPAKRRRASCAAVSPISGSSPCTRSRTGTAGSRARSPDMALAQDEGQPMRVFSLSAQLLREREAYYAALESAQRGGLDVTGWLAFFLPQVESRRDGRRGDDRHAPSRRRASGCGTSPRT